jgi:hypothetical protein
MSTQLKVLLVLGLLQFPIAIIQRFIVYRNTATGDVISGTLGVSSVLSILLVCTIIVLLAFYLRKSMSAKQLLFLSVLLFIPTTINETKGTVILLPLGLLTVLLFMAKDRESRKKILAVVGVIAILGVIFVSIYDAFFYKEQRGGGILEFFSSDNVEHYLYRGAEFDPDLLKPRDSSGDMMESTMERAPPTRIDRALAPVIMLSSDPMKLFFGLGIGNASQFRFGKMGGDYAHLSYLMGSENSMISLILWEIGIGGLLLYLAFFYMVFSDARKLGNFSRISGNLAAGWVGVVTIMVISLPYKNIMQFNVVGYLFMYFSGYVASEWFLQSRKLSKRFEERQHVRLAVREKTDA